MWSGRTRYFGIGFLLLCLVGVLLLTWLLFNTMVFGIVCSCLALALLLAWISWDGLRQTTPQSLNARGINPDDTALQIIEPGLRREFSALVPSSVSRPLSVTLGRVRSTPPGRSRLPAIAPTTGARTVGTRTAGTRTAGTRTAGTKTGPGAATRTARTTRGRRRNETLQSDATITLESERQASGIDDLFAGLESQLIGLAPVKKRVAEIGSLLLVDRARQRFGLAAESRPNLHMCFTGAPGTGKTTVALMMADLLYRLGYLQRGHLVHAMRDDLVGEYIGQTAPRTRHVLERAMGGVLFIDEAYSLYRPDDSRDYGQECVDILMQVMENERDNLVVILAGYKDRMDRFFESNPGMRSRVAHHLDFAAYEPDELLAIGELILERSSYYLSEGATAAFRDQLSVQMSDPNFANARSVRNALEEARLRHAYRLSAEPLRPWSKDDLMRIEAPDI